MALVGALPDKARTLRSTVATERVAGRVRPQPPTPGPWFRCRYEPGRGNEDKDPAHTTYRRAPSLIYGKRVTGGGLVDVRGDDTLEIVSREFGNHTVQVDGDPDPWRKRRAIVGYEAMLVLLDDDRITEA